jgi:hypothetical protein
VGAKLGAKLIRETGFVFRTGLTTGGTVGAGLLVGVYPYPDGFRQFGAFGCKHCLLLQVAPGSQQSNAELQLLPLFAMQPVEELRYVDESGIH